MSPKYIDEHRLSHSKSREWSRCHFLPPLDDSSSGSLWYYEEVQGTWAWDGLVHEPTSFQYLDIAWEIHWKDLPVVHDDDVVVEIEEESSSKKRRRKRLDRDELEKEKGKALVMNDSCLPSSYGSVLFCGCGPEGCFASLCFALAWLWIVTEDTAEQFNPSFPPFHPTGLVVPAWLRETEEGNLKLRGIFKGQKKGNRKTGFFVQSAFMTLPYLTSSLPALPKANQ
eukprot:scaffold227_cov173-Ochromonas_danica.AAC.12